MIDLIPYDTPIYLPSGADYVPKRKRVRRIKVLLDIVGVRFEGRDKYIRKHVRCGDKVRLAWDEHNEHDRNAVVALHGKKNTLGYVQRDYAKLFLWLLNTNRCCGEAIVCYTAETHITLYTEIRWKELIDAGIEELFL
jgi:hypothetical protein